MIPGLTLPADCLPWCWTCLATANSPGTWTLLNLCCLPYSLLLVLWNTALADEASAILAVILCSASLVGASPCCYLTTLSYHFYFLRRRVWLYSYEVLLLQQDLEAKSAFRLCSYGLLVKRWNSVSKILQLLQQYGNIILMTCTLKQIQV